MDDPSPGSSKMEKLKEKLEKMREESSKKRELNKKEKYELKKQRQREAYKMKKMQGESVKKKTKVDPGTFFKISLRSPEDKTSKQEPKTNTRNGKKIVNTASKNVLKKKSTKTLEEKRQKER